MNIYESKKEVRDKLNIDKNAPTELSDGCAMVCVTGTECVRNRIWN